MGTQLVKTEPEEARQKVSLPIGLSVFVFLIIAIVFAAIELKEWLADEQQMPVQVIVFTGDFEAINTKNLEAKIRVEFDQSFFSIDVNAVHEMLEQQPWVYTASIRKRWPSKLYIHIVEQDAVAIWNKDLLLNRYGDTFDGLFREMPLPSLYGPNGSEKTALEGYEVMQRLLATRQHRIEEVFLSERFAWKLRLESDIVLNLGRHGQLEYINRLQRFIDHYPSLLAHQQNIDYVDLRYDTGMAVGWLSEAKISKKNEEL